MRWGMEERTRPRLLSIRRIPAAGVSWGFSASCVPGLHRILVTPWVGRSMIPGFHEETQTTCSRSPSQREAEPGVRPR